jgi:NAD(P)-dependent dehydrogenase (short-subunit alcohol dehydrogenase family)
MLLQGKVVLVTGAAGGLGQAYARLFAKEGARLVLNDTGGARDGAGIDATALDAFARELRSNGAEVATHTESIATPEGAASLVARAKDAFGQVDVLVNNAGILRDKTLLKMDAEMWRTVLAVHLDGTFFCAQAFAREAAQQRGGGRIVNTTSVSGMLGNFGQANYSAAKAGVYGLTRTLAIELQKNRITVNAVAPIAKTRMTEDLPMFQGVETLTPEHVAPAVLFLASDLCGERTGYVLAVAGARMYAFKVVETSGRFKDGDSTVWTAPEIAENWDVINKG